MNNIIKSSGIRIYFFLLFIISCISCQETEPRQFIKDFNLSKLGKHYIIIEIKKNDLLTKNKIEEFCSKEYPQKIRVSKFDVKNEQKHSYLSLREFESFDNGLDFLEIISSTDFDFNKKNCYVISQSNYRKIRGADRDLLLKYKKAFETFKK